MKNNPTVLSVCDGMSCMQIAMVELGITPNIYYSSEVDKFAIAQTQLNFPKTIQLGDIQKIDVSALDPIDILSGGTPCTNFSFAGKRNGMATTCEIQITKLEQYLELKQAGFEFEGQSYLFWEYMRILTEIRKYNPDVLFLLENVEMGKKWERVLSEAIGVFGVHINSALVSAQNRKRIYWTNIKTEPRGLFGELHSAIPQPKDRGILLKDILESDVEEKYYLSDKALEGFNNKSPEWGVCFKPHDINTPKSDTITKRIHKPGITDPYIKVDRQLNPKNNQNKASSLTIGGHGAGNHSDMDLIIVAQRGRNPENPSDRTKGANLEQTFEPNTTGKTNCLTSVAKDNYVMCLTPKRTDYGKEIRKGYEAGTIEAQRKEISSLEPRNDGKTNTLSTVQKDNLVMQLNPSTESNGKQPYQQNRVYDANGIFPAVMQENRGFVKTSNYIEWNGAGFEQDNRAYFEDGKSGTLDIKSERQKVLINDNFYNYCLLLQGINCIFTENKNYEKESINKGNASKALRILLKEIRKKENVKWQNGGIISFQQKKILWNIMYGECLAGNTKTKVCKIHEGTRNSEGINNKNGVRNMYVKTEFGCTSQGQGLEQQLFRKFAGFVQIVSQQNTQGNNSMLNLWETEQGAWLLREALPAFQKVWRPFKEQIQGSRIRRLTPVEAARLQTVPDWYRWECSDTQIYRMCGNGWTIEVIKWILYFLPNPTT